MEEVKANVLNDVLNKSQGTLQEKKVEEDFQVINEIIIRNEKKSNKQKLVWTAVAVVLIAVLCVLVFVFPNGSEIIKLWK